VRTPDRRFDVDAFLLAGGLSSRMGTEKASLELAGRSFAQTIASAVRPSVSSIAIVGTNAPDIGVPTIPDDRPGCGPLAGIETALRIANTGAVLIVACDLPLVTTAFVRLLLERWAEGPDRIVVPEDSAGRLAPLCAVYPVSILQRVTALLDAGERKPRLLVDDRADVVSFKHYAHLAGAEHLLENVNTPADFQRLKSRPG